MAPGDFIGIGDRQVSISHPDKVVFRRSTAEGR